MGATDSSCPGHAITLGSDDRLHFVSRRGNDQSAGWVDADTRRCLGVVLLFHVGGQVVRGVVGVHKGPVYDWHRLEHVLQALAVEQIKIDGQQLFGRGRKGQSVSTNARSWLSFSEVLASSTMST